MARDDETAANPLGKAEAYDWRVGRWSRAVGGILVDWLDLPPGLRWLDVGCGAGALSHAILEAGSARRLVGIDPSDGAIATARGAITDPAAEFREGAAEALPFADGAFDVVASGLALNFMADQRRAMAEMARVVVPGGWIAAYVWDFAGDMQVMRRYWDAAIAIDPGARQADQGPRFPICRPEPLVALFTEAGLAETSVRPEDVAAEFPNFETYWHAISTGNGSTGRYAGSLSQANRRALRDRLRQTLPLRADGSFCLNARAWAVRGRRPT